MIIEALDGISDRELDACEACGEWPPREVVHHLADSEMTSALRLRRLLVEDQPEILNYDQDAYARQLWYDRTIDASLAAFRAVRETTGELLMRMSDADWDRAGTHSESGRYGALDWLEIYAVHAHDHADQIRRARATVR
ncbi:MAG TPA: DinB family protein [Thermomicrobiales bacterium]|nr:DinB family protein [Thermomicrobiales bacterium]